jgi:kynureninase
MNTPFSTDKDFARELDSEDPLAGFRDQFYLPTDPHGAPLIYFCGNSLGLQPRRARDIVEQEFSKWEQHGVDAHFHESAPWYAYHELLRESAAYVLGAREDEVVIMNSLTANLHLLMVSFYRPDARRRKILVDLPIFPSDSYAVRSQIAYHGFDVDDTLLTLAPTGSETFLPEERIAQILSEQGEEIALVLLSGVNFATGQSYDIERLTRLAHEQGCMMGLDLAHAVGNVPLELHKWNADFAVWCSYKYLNGGPGAPGGAFVHQRHHANEDLQRFVGWWGNDPTTRFEMTESFKPVHSVDAWQLSNPPILALAPLRVSYQMFVTATHERRIAKSRKLTAYLDYLLRELDPKSVTILPPQQPERRGAQLSLRVARPAADLQKELRHKGIVVDHRRPDIIRIAPTPLYNTFSEVLAFVQILRDSLQG